MRPRKIFVLDGQEYFLGNGLPEFLDNSRLPLDLWNGPPG
jgi:hypothetical protein